jgi:hypothetical protein
MEPLTSSSQPVAIPTELSRHHDQYCSVIIFNANGFLYCVVHV